MGTTRVDDPHSMDLETFRAHMQAMRMHYRTGARHRYALPTAVAVGAAVERLPNAAVAVVNTFEGRNNTFLGEQQLLTNDNTIQYTEDKDYNEFRRKLDEQKQRAKEVANRNIDEAFDQLDRIGQDNPGARQAILTVADKLVGFVSEILDRIKSFFSELAAKIVTWFKETFDKVRNFFDSALKATSAFFSSLF